MRVPTSAHSLPVSCPRWKTIRAQLLDNMTQFCTRRPTPLVCTNDEMEDLRHLSAQEMDEVVARDIVHLMQGWQSENIRTSLTQKGEVFDLNVNPSLSPRIRSNVEQFRPVLHTTAALRVLIDDVKYGGSRGRVAHQMAFECERIVRTCASIFSSVLDHDDAARRILDLNAARQTTLNRLVAARGIMERIVKDHLVGGEIVSLLGERCRAVVVADERAVIQAMHASAFSACLTPLYDWLMTGKCGTDAAREFFIWSTESASREVHEHLKRLSGEVDKGELGLGDNFVTIPALVPSEMQSCYSDVIKCGIYLNMLAEQGRNMQHNIHDIVGSPQDFILLPVAQIRTRVVRVRELLSTAILDNLVKENQLAEVFKTVHAFYMCTDSGWLMELFQRMGSKARQPKDEIGRNLLRSWWHNVRFGPMKHNEFADHFSLELTSTHPIAHSKWNTEQEFQKAKENRFVMPESNRLEVKVVEQEPLYDGQLSCIEALNVRFDCPPQLHKIFPRDVIDKFATIMRVIIFVRYHVYILGKWTQEFRRARSDDRSMYIALNHVHVMLRSFLQAMQESINAKRGEFAEKVDKAKSVEEIVAAQNTLCDQLRSARMISGLEELTGIIIDVVDGQADANAVMIATAQAREDFKAANMMEDKVSAMGSQQIDF